VESSIHDKYHEDLQIDVTVHVTFSD